MAAPQPDPITAAQRHLVAYAKLYADTIWEVQQMRGADDDKVERLGDALTASAQELVKLVSAIPDYDAEAGDDQQFLAKLQAVQSRNAESVQRLKAAMAVGEARVAGIDAVLVAAAARLCAQHEEQCAAEGRYADAITAAADARLERLLQQAEGAGCAPAPAPAAAHGGSGGATDSKS